MIKNTRGSELIFKITQVLKFTFEILEKTKQKEKQKRMELK